MSYGTSGISGSSAAYGSQPPQDPFSGSGPFANLNLTSQQQTQIQNILSQARSQGLSRSQVQSEINNVLTPDQQKTLQSDFAKLREQHQAQDAEAGSSNDTASQAAYTSTGLATDSTESDSPLASSLNTSA